MTATDDAAVADRFQALFGAHPEVIAHAPGRVNLLGEHTDYNDGHVLPIAITQQTTVALRRADDPDGVFTLHSDTLAQTLRFTLAQQPAEPFGCYVWGCLVEARDAELAVPPLQLLVRSAVPMGVGLSSSAALEVATLRALRSLLGAALDDVAIARLAQRAESLHAGVRCGILDQMASSLADTRHALWLDTRNLERRRVPLPAGSAILVLDSGTPRSLAASGYNQRRAECEAAARRLGVASLRDLEDAGNAAAAVDALPDPLAGRVRHVLSENARVMQAVRTGEAVAFGVLMNASHASLRDNYDVSVPALDALVALLQAHPAVFGARLTGAGFGGACVALCMSDRVDEVSTDVLAAYAAAGFSGSRLVPADGYPTKKHLASPPGA